MKTVSEARNFVDVLRYRAAHQQDKCAFVYLGQEGRQELRVTYDQLDRRARAIAATLQKVAHPGDRALLLYPSGLEYIEAFMGCLYAGIVAVPSYPPKKSQRENASTRVHLLASDAKPTVVLTSCELKSEVEEAQLGVIGGNSCQLLFTDQIADDECNHWQEVRIPSETLSFLQYTSGSTSAPKGVMVSHANLLHNQECIRRAFGLREQSIIVSWLPLYHDMGLIGGILQPIFVGAQCILLSPLDFLRRPLTWLETISRFQATTSGGPDFCYDLCVRKIKPEQRQGLDLRSWTVAFNGAEPVRPDTMAIFSSEFAECGFQPQAFRPCYGLAEATLMVTAGDGSSILLKQGEIQPKTPEGGKKDTSRVLVGCGAIEHHQLAIVNPDNLQRCPEDEVGEIWISSPSVACGYWDRGAETQATFGAYIKDEPGGPFLRTGDLGREHNRQLFILGRLKDVIIVRGRNYYPEDLELIAQECHKGLRRGCGSAFAVDDRGAQRIILVQEVSRAHRLDSPRQVAGAIREAISREFDLRIDEVVFVQEGGIPKTSSGKLQRHACRDMFVMGELKRIASDTPVAAPSDGPAAPIMTQVMKTMPADQQQSWAEAYLRACIGQILRDPSFCLDSMDSIASAGLDSLMVLELQNKIESDFGIRTAVSMFLEGCTLAHAASVLLDKVASSAWELAVPVRIRNVAETYPLSQGQAALWFLYQLAPKSAAYNIARAAKILGAVDLSALEKAFLALARRHPCLRTTFHGATGTQIQKVHDEINTPFSVEKLPAGGQWIETRLLEEAHRPFNLTEGPVFRVRVFETSAKEYVLLLVVHHIVSDLSSLVIMLQELGALYAFELTGKPAGLVAPQLNYSDYVQWQSNLLAGEDGERLANYWRGEFSQAPPLLDLPVDHARPAVSSFKGASLRTSLSQPVTSKLRDLAEQTGTTLFMVLLASFHLLLHRYTNQKNVSVLSPASGRTRPAFRDLVGYMVNPLLLQASVEDEATFEDLLLQVRHMVSGAFQHQDYPFNVLAQQLRSQAGPQQSSPEILFTMQTTLHRDGPWPLFAIGDAGATLNLGPLQLESVSVPQAACQFDLMLAAAECDEGIVFSWQYSTELFEAGTIARMAGHFGHLLEEIVDASTAKIGSLGLLPPSERKEALFDWNATDTAYDSRFRLHQLFENQAAKTPEAPAVVYSGKSLSYKALNQASNRLTRELIEQGVKPGDVVGVCAERSLGMVIGLLGVLKAGAAYLPLDPGYPEERLQVMLQDAGVKVVLAQTESQTQLPASVKTLILPESDHGAGNSGNPTLNVPAAALAYVIYTSGSTGRPKGVMISHASIVNRLQWMQQVYELKASDTVLQKTPFSFDVSVWEFFWPLLTGANLVLAAPGEHRDNRRLVEIIEEHAITTIHFVPSMLQAFLQSRDLCRCRSLKRVICSGEALSGSLAQECFKKMPWVDIHNLYGPTEAAVDVTYWACNRYETTQPVPIGRPIANTQMYVLDRYLNPVPVGVPGELFIGGRGLARGYTARPGLTAERFIPDPFGVPGGKLYRSGDLARLRNDGVIDFLGRIDQQVKIRGFRIEPAEIECAICEHPLVEKAAVLARSFEGEPRLICYVVTMPGGQLSVSVLRAFLKTKLPDHLVPASFIFLEHLPLSSNGKLDRNALPLPDNTRPELTEKYVAPQTREEQVLTDIWTQVLGLDRVGIHDNYFDLGGDSIRSLQVVALARQQGLHFQLAQLFQFPTVHQLAAVAETDAKETRERVRLAPFELISENDRCRLPDDVVDAYPLSALQAGLVFHSEYRSDYVVYCVSAHLRATLDEIQMQAALQTMTVRHELLRTRYDLTTFSQPLQLVQTTASVPFEIVDIRSLLQGQQEELILSWLEEEKRTRFDWRRAPFLRVKIHRRTDESFQFTFTHPLFDGWSTASLITEFFVTYFQLLNSRECREPSLLSSAYKEFVALELQAVQTEDSQNYWKRQLEGCPGTVLAFSANGHRDPRMLPVRVTREIPESVLGGLKQLAKDAGVPIKSVLLAAHLRAVSLMAGTRDITTGLICNGREEHVDGEKVPGLFLNTLPLRLSLDGGTWKDLVQCAFEAEKEMLPFRRYPFSKLQRDRGDKSLFDTAFNLINFHVYRNIQSIPEMQLIERYTSYDQTFFPLTAYFELDVFSSKALFHIDLSIETIDDLQLNILAGYYLKIMQRMAEAPLERYESQCLLEDEEIQRVVVQWNSTGADIPGGYIQSAVQEWNDDPNRIALSDEHCSLTYPELNRRANQLASYLQEMNVGPEVKVAVCLEPSVDLVVALLAIFKAGGAYLPLDPSLPQQRLAFMLQDSNAAVLITEQSLSLNVSGLPVVLIDRDHEWIAAKPECPPEVPIHPDNLAYVIYTSGSAGRPKGVAVTHRGLMNLVNWHRQAYCLTPDDRASQLARFSFDACVWELWPYLAAGASVHFPPAGTLDSPADLIKWLIEKEITISFLPTPLAEAVLQEPWPPGGRLRALLTGGDKLHRGADEQAGFTLYNHYGPTENTVVTTWSALRPERERGTSAPPIGRPILNNRVYVLDPSLQPVPTGVVGELYISGESLARGYLSRPELTAERFIPDSFSQQGGRLFRTGDLVRYQRSGDLDFVGREDHQVKIRGLRIELGEVETVLLEFSGIRQAAVVLHHQPTQYLAGYLVAERKDEISIGSLIEHLRQRLPQYMVPSSFVFLAELPLTHNGKVDRVSLLATAPTQIMPTASFVAPRTPLEEQIAQIWSRTLGREGIGVEDNFFELGGHSLTATQIISRIRADLAVNISLRSLFEGPTISGLARVIEAERNESEGADLDRILEEIESLSDEEVLQRIASSAPPDYPM
jgi:amino acid adenylation domain-containing protein